MISFESFCLRDGVPIYLQIIKHVKSGIVSGKIKNGEELPSRRVLSALLGLNPNTVQRAYSLLEERGFIRSVPKKGAFVAYGEDGAKESPLRREVTDMVAHLRDSGVTREELALIIEEVYGND